MSTRQTLLTKAKAYLQYPQELDDADLQSFANSALYFYSRLKPREKYHDITGSGSYDLSLPSDWDDNFSSILSVEYPAGKRDPVFLKSGRDYIVYKSTNSTILRLLTYTPTSSETIRICYTVPHTLDDTTSTIPTVDEEALALMIASFAAFSLAARYTQISNDSLGADVIDYGARASDMRRVAEDLKERWSEMLGFKEDTLPPETAMGDLDLSFSWNRDFIIHRRGLD
jgi:hypothetical protein